MGSPSSKISRKKKEERQKNSEEPFFEENKFSGNYNKNKIDINKINVKINDSSRDFNLNNLPRQKTGSEEIIRAINDVNQRISKSAKKPSYSDCGISSNQGLDSLVKEIRHKAENLDIEQKKPHNNNLKKLSGYYSKLSRSSFDEKAKDSNEATNKSVKKYTSQTLKEHRQLKISDEIKISNDLEADKKKTTSKHNRYLAVQKMKLGDATLINKSLNNLDSIKTEPLAYRKKVRTIKDLTKLEPTYEMAKIEPIDSIFQKRNDKALKSIRDLFDDEVDEPIYYKSKDLKMIEAMPDADVIQIFKAGKNLKDLYNIDSDELNQIIKFVEEKESQNSDNRPKCSYYLGGREIYSTIKNDSKSHPISCKSDESNILKIASNFDEKKILKILEELDFKIEDKYESIKKNTILNLNKNKLKINESTALSNQNKSKPQNDLMPNVTKLIESLEDKKQTQRI